MPIAKISQLNNRDYQTRKKARPNYMLVTRNTNLYLYKDTNWLKVKGRHQNQEEARVLTSASDKGDFRATIITAGKDLFIINQEDITILNIHALRSRALRSLKQN